jgi:hypothetical protein
MMVRYQVFHPDHEFLGQVLLDIGEAGPDGARLKTYFEKHGLSDVDAQTWYPAQTFVDVFNEMEATGEMQMLDFVSVGLKVAENAILPPEVATMSLGEVLQTMDAAYRLNNRGTDVGEIRCEQVADKHYQLLVRVPYPDDMWYGITYGYMRRMAPNGTRFTVAYDEDAPGHHEGGEYTVIHVTWD